MGEARDHVEPRTGGAPLFRLRGSAFALLYRLPREALLASRAVPDEARDGFRGGTSALLLADYESSDLGPHREVLFVPGRFACEAGSFHSVTRGWVSSGAVAARGLPSWGLRRELAEVTIERSGPVHRVTLSRPDRSPIAAFTLRAGRLGVPVTADLLPAARRTILQRVEGGGLLTTLAGRASLGPARVESVRVFCDDLPDLSRIQPVMAVRLEGLSLALPEALPVDG